MKELLPGYYPLTQAEYDQLWSDAIFVFDTSVLLNVYRLQRETTLKVLELIERLGDRVWLPHQVMLEYHRNQPGVVGEVSGTFTSLAEKIKSARKQLNEEFRKAIRNRHPFLDDETMIEYLENGLAELYKYLDKQRQEYEHSFNANALDDKLLRLFEGKVGEPYSTEKLIEICNIGKQRYELLIPPGYEDRRSKGDGIRQFGDVISWFQILDIARRRRQPVILVSDDAKDDWWEGPRGKREGPRRELINEMSIEAGVRFHIYSSVQFLQLAEKYLGVPIDTETVEDAEDLRVFDENIIRLYASDAIAVNEFLKEAIAPEKIAETFRQAILAMSSLATINAINQQWLDSLDISAAQKEKLAAILKPEAMSQRVREVLEKSLSTELVNQYLASIDIMEMMDISSFQESLADIAVAASRGPILMTEMNRLIDQAIRQALDQEKLFESVTEFTKLAVKSGQISEAVQPFLIQALKEVENEGTEQKRGRGSEWNL